MLDKYPVGVYYINTPMGYIVIMLIAMKTEKERSER